MVGGLVIVAAAAATAAATSAAMGLSGACAPAKRPPVSAGAGATGAAPQLFSARAADAPLGVLFGVNEGLSVPAQLVRSRRLDAAAQRVELESDARDLTALGVRVVRANSHTYPFLHFSAYARDPALALSYSDLYFSVLGDAGLDAVMVVGPWPGIQTANHTDRYLPDDMAGYAAFVQAVVERYDGDGVDDMPGLLRPALAWEIDNEPDLHNAVRPRGARADAPDPAHFETPAEYAEIVRVTSAAIRAADADATILLGGMYNPRSESGRAYLDAVLAAPGVRAAFDVLSLHCYRDEDRLDALDETIAVAAAVAPDKPLWITEIGVSSVGRAPFQTEDWQAEMVAALYGEALASGVERVFWHTLADPPERTGGGGNGPDGGGEGGADLPFSHHSLYRSLSTSWETSAGRGPQRERKPSGQMVARLTERLSGATWGQVRRGEAGGGRLVWVGEAGLVYWGAVDLPARPGGWQIEDLRTGQVQEGARAEAPAWVRPQPEESGQ